MQKPIDAIRLLSSAAMEAKKAGTYSPDTHVIDLEELRQIIFEMQEDAASPDEEKSTPHPKSD